MTPKTKSDESTPPAETDTIDGAQAEADRAAKLDKVAGEEFGSTGTGQAVTLVDKLEGAINAIPPAQVATALARVNLDIEGVRGAAQAIAGVGQLLRKWPQLAMILAAG